MNKVKIYGKAKVYENAILRRDMKTIKEPINKRVERLEAEILEIKRKHTRRKIGRKRKWNIAPQNNQKSWGRFRGIKI